MRFWDSSAVVPLLLEQPRSDQARTLLEEDVEVMIWWGTPMECGSAFARPRREGLLSEVAETESGRQLARLRATWYEMTPSDQLRALALRLLRVHPISAADALQLAAAMEWAGTPASGTFVTFDERLASAAVREGFTVHGP